MATAIENRNDQAYTTGSDGCFLEDEDATLALNFRHRIPSGSVGIAKHYFYLCMPVQPSISPWRPSQDVQAFTYIKRHNLL